MKRWSILILMFLLAAGLTSAVSGSVPHQAQAPTLVPPTPVPVADPGEQEILPSQSTIARIQTSGVVRVGILYNAPPFGELNIRGNIAGFDAELARSMAELWGVEVEFVQVTRQTERAVGMLRDGDVDLLLAALVHRRDLDGMLDFSLPYYIGSQSMMVRADDAATTLAEMAGRRIGAVIATPAEAALRRWAERAGGGATVETFLTLDRAHVALEEGRIDGLVDTAVHLTRVSELRPENIRILAESLEREPYAIGMLRQDVNLRNLVNRTLQHLVRSGRMTELYQFYFPGVSFSAFPLWANLPEDAPVPTQYSTEVSIPSAFTLPRVQSTGVVRVAGLIGVTADSDAPESERRLDTLHRLMLTEMARRWGVTVEFVPDSAGNALELVASGQADIAVGVTPDWNWVDRVDFTGYYLLHGERLMVLAQGDVANFADLANETLATPVNEASAASRAVEIAESINVRIDILQPQPRENDLAFVLLENEDAEAAFGDSLRLVPHVQAFPNGLRLTTEEDRGDNSDRWYSRTYVAMAVPRNDIDFRLLVEYTLQELVRDGTLRDLLQPLMMPEDIPDFIIWPGASQYLGYNLGS